MPPIIGGLSGDTGFLYQLDKPCISTTGTVRLARKFGNELSYFCRIGFALCFGQVIAGQAHASTQAWPVRQDQTLSPATRAGRRRCSLCPHTLRPRTKPAQRTPRAASHGIRAYQPSGAPVSTPSVTYKRLSDLRGFRRRCPGKACSVPRSATPKKGTTGKKAPALFTSVGPRAEYAWW
jgi:hypothetical protein